MPNSSLSEMGDSGAESAPQPTVSAFARYIHGWTWQAFPIGMGTGAVYVTLSGLEDRFNALTTIETGFYFINMALFVVNTGTLLLQTILYPRQAWRLVQDPVKGIFVPLIVLSFATIIIGTVNYAFPSGHASAGFIYALFWVYVVFAVLTCFPMIMIWFNKPHDLMHFTPAYAFLIFPMMLVGVVSFNVLRVIDASDPKALGVLLVGYFFQGLGSFMTFFYLCIYVIRVMTTGFLEGHQANGAFVACGPPGFTALALIKLAEHARDILPSRGYVTENAGEIWYGSSVLTGLLLYGLAVFFFIFGVLPYWSKLHKNLNEILGCWALTFPNVGWISVTRTLGDIFGIEFLYIIHLCLTIVMVLTWIILFVLTIVAFWKGLIFKSKEEDVLKDILPAYNEHEDTGIHAVTDGEQDTARPMVQVSEFRPEQP
ncbi:voltage-dependent anion channel-domain-containing protein [Desarmillaria tabescens]|uniref:Voltage-dependent anion channel-domain-containing protein n=1 Tax=Armillaria tabescens TaxID=1929756 RepID=A0AA39KF59_ARMTA|nr:voltage-dependent anion channel-domain-containing protein [Desarmillaria tabescens]KAK0460049.1 voltage-dependent anion channel-domain-containing protein [Desarmillaria tabescens]